MHCSARDQDVSLSQRKSGLILLAALAAASAAAAASGGAQWPMPAGDYANTRFSPLTEITPANARHLTVGFTFSTGLLRGHEAAPIVDPEHDVRRDALPERSFCAGTRPAGRALKWKYEPKPRASAQGVACCDTVNRGAAYDDDRVFFNTPRWPDGCRRRGGRA